MEERGIPNIMNSFECSLTVVLVCIESVDPFEEIVLDGPGNSSRGMAQWAYVNPLQEQAELLSAPAIPMSDQGHFLNQGTCVIS